MIQTIELPDDVEVDKQYRRYYTELFTKGTFYNAIEDENIKQKTIEINVVWKPHREPILPCDKFIMCVRCKNEELVAWEAYPLLHQAAEVLGAMAFDKNCEYLICNIETKELVKKIKIRSSVRKRKTKKVLDWADIKEHYKALVTKTIEQEDATTKN